MQLIGERPAVAAVSPHGTRVIVDFDRVGAGDRFRIRNGQRVPCRVRERDIGADVKSTRGKGRRRLFRTGRWKV
jgi:hypothetical protein